MSCRSARLHNALTSQEAITDCIRRLSCNLGSLRADSKGRKVSGDHLEDSGSVDRCITQFFMTSQAHKGPK